MKDCVEADILMVNANHIRESFVDRGFDPKKVRVVYLGVRDDFRDVAIKRLESGKKNNVPRVLFTGNFSLLKGAEYLLESLRILNERGVKVHYDVVGSISVPRALMGDERGGMRDERAASLTSIPHPPSPIPSITFHGPVPQDDLKAFLAESDIYLFPSLADGCAQSGMEALTAGLPVVATYQSGLPITDGETGSVVPMKDAAAIADKIEWLIAHPEERERLGRNAAKMMREKYTWEKYAENVKKIYEEMISDA
jgi:glycosyltransferase involved in cell wall biosynthesis